ncbi:MAG: hypothetical protein AAF567_12890 [Actinomycetota bacterium]
MAVAALGLLGAGCGSAIPEDQRTLVGTIGEVDAPTGAWADDLAFLASELGERHVDPFHNISAADFQAEVDGSISRSADWTQTVGYYEVARLVGLVGDSHTIVIPPANVERYPIVVQPLDDGLMVDATARADRDLLSGELLAIDGIPVADLITLASEYVSADTDAGRARQAIQHITSPAFIELTRLARPEPGTITVRRSDGETIEREVFASETADLELLPNDARPRLLIERQPDAFYWTQDIADSNTIYMNYRRAQEADDLPMAELAEFLTDAADREGFDRLIIDLRQNTGGNSLVLQPLVDALAGHALGDDVYVLIGPRTFSSAILNAITLRDVLGATLVGQPTLAPQSHYGEVQTFTLPDSNLVVSYSTMFFDRGSDQPLAPDVEVEITMDDLRSGIDPALDAALSHGR